MQKNGNILIGMPVMENINFNVVGSIMRNTAPDIVLALQAGSLVYVARQMLTEIFLKDKRFDYLFFWDSDIVLPPQTIQRLREHDKDIVSICYYSKDPPYQPIFFKESDGNKYKWIKDTEYLTLRNENNEIPLQEAVMVGLGGCLIKRSVLEYLVKDVPDMYFPLDKKGEDATFCKHLIEAGFKLWVDPNIVVGHVGYAQRTYQDFTQYLMQHGNKKDSTQEGANHIDL